MQRSSTRASTPSVRKLENAEYELNIIEIEKANTTQKIKQSQLVQLNRKIKFGDDYKKSKYDSSKKVQKLEDEKTRRDDDIMRMLELRQRS